MKRMIYLCLSLCTLVINSFAQEALTREKILTGLPVNLSFAGVEPNHPSGYPVTSFFSDDQTVTAQMYESEADVVVLSIMFQLKSGISEVNIKLMHAVVQNVFGDSLKVNDWLDKELSDLPEKGAKNITQTFGERTINATYYPKFLFFVTIAKVGVEIKHH